MPFPELFLRGFWYSATILLILGCHEMGHYLACRYYDVDASLPFFIPMPLLFSGTLGAFIRIREPIPRKRMLFDIGIAGPIAGFAVAVPALFIGIAMSHVVQVPTNTPGLLELGEPLDLQTCVVAVLGHAGGRLLPQHASHGVRRLVRSARDGAEPLSDRSTRRRSHRVRDSRTPRRLRHLRDGWRRSRVSPISRRAGSSGRSSPSRCCFSSDRGIHASPTKMFHSMALVFCWRFLRWRCSSSASRPRPSGPSIC